MSFRDITPGRSNKGYAPMVNKGNSKLRPTDGENLSTSIEDIKLDMKNLDSKILEFGRMIQNLGTRVDNQTLRNEMKKAMRDLDSMQNKLSMHIDEMEQHAKVKGKTREMLKQLSELKRTKEKKSVQIKDAIDKAERFMQDNPPQYAATYLDTEEVEQQFGKANSGNANLQYNEMLIRERHEDITALATEMTEVQTAFKDLAEMIADQGEMVEDIENNITSAAEHSKQGVRQLIKAKDQQVSSRRKCWTILIVIIVIVLVFVGIMLWIEISKHSKE